MMMCQCGFIDVPHWCGILIVREAVCVLEKGSYGNSLIFCQFFWEPKTAIRKWSIFKYSQSIEEEGTLLFFFFLISVSFFFNDYSVFILFIFINGCVGSSFLCEGFL